MFRDCVLGSLDASKVRGRIVLCFNAISNDVYTLAKIYEIIDQGARGLIMVDDSLKIESDTIILGHLTFPHTFISSKDGNAALSYIQSNR